MATEKQLEANRRNALKSTGPKSPEGKAAVRFNALTSGVHAVSPLIPGEDPAEFKAFAEGLTNSSNPADEREQILVDQMIYFGWRLRRLMAAETQSWTRTFETIETYSNYREDTKLADSFKICEQTHLRLQRFLTSVQKSYHQAAADLDRLQSLRAKSPQPQPHHPLTEEIGFVPSTYVNTIPALSAPLPGYPPNGELNSGIL